MSARKIIAGLILLACCGKQTFAQDECEVILAQATEEFNAGHLYGISAILKDCLDKNQNREWRQRAYLLLSETYLLLEDPLGAELSYLNVLHANPEFLTDQNRDPIDLVYLSGKFTATPIFELHAYGGPSITPVRLIHDVRVSGESQHYSVRLGWHIGVGFDFNYNDYFSASAGLNFSQTVFKHSATNLFGLNRDIGEFIDHQSWATFPIAVKYCQPKGKVRRYGYVGFSINYLLADKADVEIKNRDLKTREGQTEEFSTFDKTISNINLIQNRQRMNGTFFVGGGLKYKYKLDYFYVDLRYSFGVRNLVDPKNRYNSVSEGLPLPYVDDDLRIDNLAVSVGYIHPLYKPRKLKKARTKSLLRKIEKEDNATN